MCVTMVSRYKKDNKWEPWEYTNKDQNELKMWIQIHQIYGFYTVSYKNTNTNNKNDTNNV